MSFIKKAVLVLSLGWSTAAVAAPLINEPVLELRLVSGKILRDAQAKGFLARSVLVKHSEGAETVAYDDFPAEYRESLLLKRPSPSTDPAPRPVGLPIRKKVPGVDSVSDKKIATESAVPIRPTITLSTSRVGSNYTTVELYNDSDTPTELRCSALQAETSAGTVLKGRQWVAADVPDMVSNSLGTKQVLAPHASAALNVVFDPLPYGASITRVFLAASTK